LVVDECRPEDTVDRKARGGFVMMHAVKVIVFYVVLMFVVVYSIRAMHVFRCKKEDDEG